MAPLFLRLDRQGGDNPAGKGDGPAAPRLTPSTRTAPSGPRTAPGRPRRSQADPQHQDGPQRGGGCPLAVIGRGYTPCGYV